MVDDFQARIQSQLNDIIEIKKEKFVYEGDFMAIEHHVALMKDDLIDIKNNPYSRKEKENLRGYIRTTYSELLKKLKQLFIDKKNKEINKLWDDHGVAIFTNKAKYPSVVILKVEGVFLPIK